jgi:hypothetical protein
MSQSSQGHSEARARGHGDIVANPTVEVLWYGKNIKKPPKKDQTSTKKITKITNNHQ